MPGVRRIRRRKPSGSKGNKEIVRSARVTANESTAVASLDNFLSVKAGLREADTYGLSCMYETFG